HRPRRPRQRHGRVHPRAVERLRARRAEAHAGANDARAPHRRVLGPADARARPHAQRARLGCCARRRLRTRPRWPGPRPRARPAGPYAEEVDADPRRLRVGTVAMRMDDDPLHPECLAAVEATEALLEELGHDVAPARLEALATPDFGFLGIYGSAIARDLDRWGARIGRTLTPSDLDPMNAVTAELGRSITGAQYLAATEAAHDFSRPGASWGAAGA